MKLIFTIQGRDNLTIELKSGPKVMGRESLTISQDLDTLLIKAIDKIVAKNRIDRLRLKSAVILGKMRPGAVSAMILESAKTALES